MDIFVVDGSNKNFADVILDYRVNGATCAVASYGFGVNQVMRLINAFEDVLLVADTSHSQLNAKAYKTIEQEAKRNKKFSFRPIKTHAKFALIDDEVLVFTSANLSANQKMESYLVGNFGEFDGVETLKNIMGDPDSVFKTSKKAEKASPVDMLGFDVSEL